jgi:hypothetical protein
VAGRVRRPPGASSLRRGPAVGDGGGGRRGRGGVMTGASGGAAGRAGAGLADGLGVHSRTRCPAGLARRCRRVIWHGERHHNLGTFCPWQPLFAGSVASGGIGCDRDGEGRAIPLPSRGPRRRAPPPHGPPDRAAPCHRRARCRGPEPRLIRQPPSSGLLCSGMVLPARRCCRIELGRNLVKFLVGCRVCRSAGRRCGPGRSIGVQGWSFGCWVRWRCGPAADVWRWGHPSSGRCWRPLRSMLAGRCFGAR